VPFDEGKIKKLMAEMREKAVSGNPSAKYTYAYFLGALPSFTHYTPIADSNENPNKWYLAAANSGSAISSFSLGRNILNGDMCTADGNKSMGWLLKAASQNVIDAQYLLALELFSGAHLEKNEEQAMYWLRKAADHNSPGNMAAKLRYAGILATNPDKDQRNGKLATTYLNQVNEEYRDKQTYYQVSAAVFAENGDFDAAVKWQIKAQKDAQKLNLPEQKINERLEAYGNRKAWREMP
ncbi:MAG TPA: tetratricopeptide repeat protein, partial [Herbaspirillum sp.]|nr:tetratricopeptide repeat protein [Herbaspirillum sp.]